MCIRTDLSVLQINYLSHIHIYPCKLHLQLNGPEGTLPGRVGKYCTQPPLNTVRSVMR